MVPETPQKPKKTSLDTSVNIAILLVCVLAIFVLIPKAYEAYQWLTNPRPGSPQQVAKGDRFDQLKAVLPAGTSRALVVAVSPGCHFCNESMPFYKQLLDHRNQKSSPVKFIAAVPFDAAKEEEARKFASAGAQPDGLVQLDFAAVKVPGTPTLMLVDNNGEVLGVWVGKLAEDGQKEVLAVL
jgi:thioredoxin-related protein